MYQDRAKARKNALLGTQMQMNEQQTASAGNLSGNAGDLMSTAAMMSGMSKNSLPKKTGGMGFAEGE